MSAKNVLGIIFSNAYDDVIPELTALRTMGSVPFAGGYRLIDFPLSDMVNAGIARVGVITNSNYRSLMDHVGNGKPWDLSRKREGLTILPPFSLPDTGMFKGKVDALYGSIDYISDSGKDYVLMTDCNTVCRMDYDDMLKYAISKNADITVAYAKGIPGKVSGAVEYVMDENQKVTALQKINNFDNCSNYSIKVMLIRRTLLERLLHEANAKRISDFDQLLAQNIDRIEIYGYLQTGYVKSIVSPAAYYAASLDLLKSEVRKDLFAPDKPVYTKTSDRIPAFYGISAEVSDSLVGDGCRVEGKVENCILFRGVKIGKGAVVKNSIIMQDTCIGDGAEIECVVADKDVNIRSGKKLCGASTYPVFIGKGTVI